MKTNQLPPHTITIRDHPEPHIMQWSDLELAAIKKYAECYALQARAQVQGEPVAWCIEALVDDEWFVQYPITFTKQGAELDASCYTPGTALRIRPLTFGDTTSEPAQATQAVSMTNEQWTDVLGSAGPDMLDLAKQWADNKIHVYQVVNRAEKIVKAAVLRGITAQIKMETP